MKMIARYCANENVASPTPCLREASVQVALTSGGNARAFEARSVSVNCKNDTRLKLRMTLILAEIYLGMSGYPRYEDYRSPTASDKTLWRIRLSSRV